MQITDVRVRKVAKEGKLKAVVSITIDDEFVVHDIKVIEGEKGMFIAMPSKKAMDGEYRDIAHPINSNTRERIQSMILEKYEQALAEEPDGENPIKKTAVSVSPHSFGSSYLDPESHEYLNMSQTPIHQSLLLLSFLLHSLSPFFALPVSAHLCFRNSRQS